MELILNYLISNSETIFISFISGIAISAILEFFKFANRLINPNKTI